jgi:hypothetical protein
MATPEPEPRRPKAHLAATRWSPCGWLGPTDCVQGQARLQPPRRRTSLEFFLWLRRQYNLSLRQTRETITELARTLLRD